MRLPLVLGASVLCVLVLVPAAANARTSGCTPGVKTVGGVTQRTFCGPAKATVRFGAQKLTFSGGSCEASAQYLSVNIGTVVLGVTTKPKPDYFGLDVGRLPGSSGKPAPKDGVYVGNAVLALDYGGRPYLALGTTLRVTLAGNRTHGTLSGTALSGGGKVTGTFSC